MTGGTAGVAAVLRKPLLHGDFGSDVGIVEGGNIIGRRRRRCAQQVFEHPLATNGRRGAGGIRRYRQNGALREDAAAGFAIERDALECFAVDTRNAVVAGEGTVHIGEWSIDEIEDAAILLNDFADKQAGFLTHGVEQFVVDVGKALRIRLGAAEIAELQPLRSPVLGQVPLRFGIGEHALDLSLEDIGLAQRTGFGGLVQLLVGHGRP